MTRTTAKKDRKARPARAGITDKSLPTKQGFSKWADRPAGFHIDGDKIATLEEVREPSIPTMSLVELKNPQRLRLVLASLRAKPDDFTVGMIGPGIINKTRAIAEVEAQSSIGRTLMEIELMLLSTLASQGQVS